MLLLQSIKQLGPGDETGIVIAIDGDVLPGKYVFGSFWSGGHVIIPGPDNLKAGSYMIVAPGGMNSRPAGQFQVLLPMGPGDYLSEIGTGGASANASFTIPDNVWLNVETWDLVPAPASATTKAA